MHAVDILRARLDAHEDGGTSRRLARFRIVGIEHDLAARRARRGRQPGGDDLPLGLRVDGGMEELVEGSGIDPRNGLVAGDQPVVGHFDGDPQRGAARPLAAARLQHPQLAGLDGEFHVLHVAIVALEQFGRAAELGEDLRQRRLHRRLVGPRLDPGGLGDVLRRADAGDDVLALGIDQELAVEFMRPGRGVAGEGDAGRRRLAHIAEHHGLDVDGGTPGGRNGL